MSQSYSPPQPMPGFALSVDARATFIRRTYTTLFFAVMGFTMTEIWLFTNGMAEQIATAMMGTSWLLVLGAFMLVSYVATRVAHQVESLPAQYGMLALMVGAWSILFVPLLYAAESVAPGAIQNAAWVTGAGFAGLTGIAFVTRKNFSFLRGILGWAIVLAFVLIGCSLVFGLQLGTWFSVGMVGVAGASILYDTSNVIHEYPEDRYVGAAIQLFGSVALLFWYVIQLFMSRD